MFENDGELPYKKPSRKKKAKKSNHKHDYEVHKLEDEPTWWFNMVEICTICGKEGSRFREKDQTQ